MCRVGRDEATTTKSQQHNNNDDDGGGGRNENHNHQENEDDSNNDSNTDKSATPSKRPLVIFCLFLLFITVVSFVLMTPFIPIIQRKEYDSSDDTKHFHLSTYLLDLYVLTTISTLLSIYAIIRNYYFYHPTTNNTTITNANDDNHDHDNNHIQNDPNLFHPNGDKKSRDDLEEEALEAPLLPKIKTYLFRPCFLSELLSILQGIYIVIKCLARLNVEIGIMDETIGHHPVFWIALLISAFGCVLTTLYLESISELAGQIGMLSRRYSTGHGTNSKCHFLGCFMRCTRNHVIHTD
eukprot:CAMPEP_0184871128 /NCGR_PEP_ID=MMETSP0580-20130426/40065_1 /TAXON_ID=1118495 /ORGANISM="Dactyliosolen fragilissimus" /LENGTH=294 /DNA_ID=CAMNT_0027373663 /DNA_START=61 /DNA_END=942 /DNA_ORIENTATION=-